MKIGNKTVKRGPYLSHELSDIYGRERGLICSMLPAPTRARWIPFSMRLTERADCEIYHFRIGDREGVDNGAECDFALTPRRRGNCFMSGRKTTMTTRQDDKDQKAARELVQRFDV